MFDKILSDINEEFKTRVKNHLVVESYFYFTNAEKKRLDNDHNINSEVNINLIKFHNIHILAAITTASVLYDLYFKKQRNLKYLVSNGIKRILIGNFLYYAFLTDYDTFYSILYRKYIKNNLL